MALTTTINNLAVRDIVASRKFFEGLGFKVNEEYSDETTFMLLVNDAAYYMFMTHEKFEEFTKIKTVDSQQLREVILGFGVETKDQVDEMLEKVIQNGGTEFGETTDWGWLYLRSFKDLDGHHFEVVFMQS